jgi:DNA repair protein RecN (Recombination protein N)
VLEQLTIQNYALIDRLHIDFTEGMNVLSGETGAGKSILAGALSLLHGSRADTGAIRTGADETMVSGTFVVEGNEDAEAWLSEHAIEPEDGAVIIRRTVKRTGRGTIYIQSAPVTRGDLEDFTNLILDLHGQHEHQSLLSEDNHRKLLDRYAGLEEEVNALSERFGELTNLKRRRERLVSSEQERMREMDFLSYAVQEIEEANLTEGEEDELEQERSILSQHEKLAENLDSLYESLAESRGGALGQIREARHAMETVNGIDSGLSPVAKRLDDAFFELEDIAETVRDYASRVEFSAERLEQVEDRIAAIHRLEKKYGADISDVLRYAEEAREQLAALENYEEDKAQLEEDIKRTEREVLETAHEISRKRKAAAEELQRRIEGVLGALGMKKTRFHIGVEQKMSQAGKPVCGSYGIDSVAFRLAPNPGEPVKPLKDIASGGEISRVMLAVKTVLAEADRIQTLVFDEIDAGIGGEVALAVGEYLKQLSGGKQVMCITHLASIAVRADNHIKVEKLVEEDRTVTRVAVVDGSERVEEIARMLAGDRTGKTSRTHAEELLEKYGSKTA